jgi:hypothetical protein
MEIATGGMVDNDVGFLCCEAEECSSATMVLTRVDDDGGVGWGVKRNGLR